MKLNSLLRALAVLPVLAAGCDGVTDLFGTDGGNVCTGVPTVYSVGSGMYTITKVTNLNDGCGTGVTAAALENTKRQVTNDTMTGAVTIAGAAGNPNPLGSGPVRCNSGTLKFGPTIIASTDVPGCNFEQTRTSTLTVTSSKTLKLDYSEARRMHAAACTQKTDCVVSFTMELTNN